MEGYSGPGATGKAPPECQKHHVFQTDKCFIGPLNQIKIKGQGIQVVKESKALGVFIDQKLSWKKQVTTVRKSFYTKIKLLKRLGYLPPNVFGKNLL